MVNYKEYECESCGYTVTTNSRGKDMVMMEEIYSYNKRTVPLLQEILRQAGKWNGAANRVYYSVFHAVNALFINDGIQSSRHKASHALFSLNYIKTGKLPADYGRLYNNLQTLREKSDYNCFYQVTEQDIADSVELVRQFIEAIEKLINNNV